MNRLCLITSGCGLIASGCSLIGGCGITVSRCGLICGWSLIASRCGLVSGWSLIASGCGLICGWKFTNFFSIQFPFFLSVSMVILLNDDVIRVRWVGQELFIGTDLGEQVTSLRV